MDALAEALSHAQTTGAIGQVIADAAGQRIGVSGVSFLRISGPLISPHDLFALCSRESPAYARARLMDILPLIDREIVPWASFFASKCKSFDGAERFPEAVVRRSEVFNTLWRPLGVERQLVGALGTAEAPRGFICAARSAKESPFRPADLEALEAIRVVVDRALVTAQHLGCGALDDTLTVLSRATPAPWFLFDPAGNLLWLTEEACSRLSADALRIGSSIALRHSEALEQLRAWVRAEARRQGPASPHAPPACAAAVPGEQFVMRRFEAKSGRPLFLVGFAEPPACARAAFGDAPAPETALRAARLARERVLTRRQTEVLAHLATGKANKTIAALLGCGESAVELHVTALLSKFGCENRAELVARFWTS